MIHKIPSESFADQNKNKAQKCNPALFCLRGCLAEEPVCVRVRVCVCARVRVCVCVREVAAGGQ